MAMNRKASPFPTTEQDIYDAPPQRRRQHEPFRLQLSLRFVAFSVLSATAFAFVVGRVCRYILLNDFHLTVKVRDSLPEKIGRVVLPQPMLAPGKEVPHTIYTAKQFDTGVTTQSDSVLARRSWGTEQQQHERKGSGFQQHVEIAPDGSIPGIEESYIEELHEPAGQHLLVDIAGVEAAFLNSEERLAQAMVTLVEMSGLTMLSYHCHALEPIGVSCVGVLLESHVSFHTWPIEGVITFDIFTCGPNPLEPLLPYIEKLFGPRRDPNVAPDVQWAHKLRGFQKDRFSNPESVEMDHYVLGLMAPFDLKERVASVETKFQTIDIFDVINRRFHTKKSFEKSLSNDGSYESQNPDLFRPDRVVYLDQVSQSRLFGEAGYHEALVHPGMFAHNNPKRVAIIGGGEGATLREVLKHNTVEKVTMVEIDEGMVNTSRAFLPEWSSCAQLEGGYESCFDDPRSEVIFTDAIAWFIDNFSKGKDDVDESNKYDVIIMDALDPSSVIEFSDILYNNNEFVGSLYNALTEEGVLIAQVGEADHPMDAPTELSKSVHRGKLIEHLTEEGFDAIKDYEEAHGFFLSPWGFIVAMKDDWSQENWYASEAMVNVQIRKRIIPRADGGSPLRFFDGAGMMSYTYPSRVVENVYCRSEPKPPMCENGHGFDPAKANADINTLEVKQSNIPGAGRGVFFKKSLPKDTYIAIDAAVHDIQLLPHARRVVKSMLAAGRQGIWKTLEVYIFGYGFSNDFYGDAAYNVDASVMTFINHGCNATNNMGTRTSVTEVDADPKHMPPELEYSLAEGQVHSPFADRNHLIYLTAIDTTLRDITAGEELLDNYLAYLHTDNWEWGVGNYRAQCLQQGSGVVTDYEKKKIETVVVES